jgi:hypothetical protein
VMAFIAVAALGFLLNHAGRMRHFEQSAGMQPPAASQNAGSLPGGVGPGGAGSPAAAAQPSPTATSADQASAGPLEVQRSTSAQTGPGLDDATRQRVLEAVEATLRASYSDKATGELTAKSLVSSENHGLFRQFTNPGIFAFVVTQQMRAVSGDSGLVLYFVATPLPNVPLTGPIHWIDPRFLLRVPEAPRQPQQAPSV